MRLKLGVQHFKKHFLHISPENRSKLFTFHSRFVPFQDFHVILKFIELLLHFL